MPAVDESTSTALWEILQCGTESVDIAPPHLAPSHVLGIGRLRRFGYAAFGIRGQDCQLVSECLDIGAVLNCIGERLNPICAMYGAEQRGRHRRKRIGVRLIQKGGQEQSTHRSSSCTGSTICCSYSSDMAGSVARRIKAAQLSKSVFVVGK